VQDQRRIPVIDLFAGPGGLGEGFSSYLAGRSRRAYSIRLSIEKDPIAHRTLELRALYRHLRESAVPDDYYDHLRGSVSRDDLFNAPGVRNILEEVQREARCATLGHTSSTVVDAWIADAIRGEDDWVLIGGPPCQAYSLAGRSRRRNEDRSTFEGDHRHLLYEEYLRIIRRFHPPVFVMENVKGILSSTLGGKRIFERIVGDLASPRPGLRYEIRSFTSAGTPTSPAGYIIEAEKFGVPQARHRVILLGVREDYSARRHRLLVLQPRRSKASDVLSGLPPLRSRLSREPDSPAAWRRAIADTVSMLGNWPFLFADLLNARMQSALHDAATLTETGGDFVPATVESGDRSPLQAWLTDTSLGGFCGHRSRSHIRSDIQRYFFLAAFGDVFKFSPRLGEFPPALLPDHRNVDSPDTPFEDRFRVQLWDAPSTTLVSHIAKDGHYYVHPDPKQARSLTFREAARLQTFPDNYHFAGNRTEQFVQAGNAVPPYLAVQLAGVVHSLLDVESAGTGDDDPDGTGAPSSSARPEVRQALRRGVL
jgi:DNA (cytosine-5)-methyltransferase 1